MSRRIERPGRLESRVRLTPRAPATYGSRSRSVLVTGPHGFIGEESERERIGLWVDGTRMLSCYRWSIDGADPLAAGSSWVDQHRWLGYYIHAPSNWRDTPTKESSPMQESVELRLSRSIGAGMHEDVDLTNHTQVTTTSDLTLHFDADFVDPEEVPGDRKQHGTIERQWRALDDGTWELRIEYHARHEYDHQGQRGTAELRRAMVLTIAHASSAPVLEGSTIAFRVRLAPHQSWHACLRWRAETECVPADAPNDCPFCAAAGPDRWEKRSDAALHESADLEAPGSCDFGSVVLSTFRRAREDLVSLRLFDLDERGTWTLAAGVPDYVALFGRDALIAASQGALVDARLLAGTLDRLSRWQASAMDGWRDAQPGRVVHELHTSPLATLRFNPHGRYYGDVTASIDYPFALAELWRWTGDEVRVRRLADAALQALHWADEYLRPQGSPFYRYLTRSEQGEKNQSWKDSSDAIVNPDGSQVAAPIGTGEMQASVYNSKVALAEVLADLGRHDDAARLERDAAELKKRFNDAFWMEEERYFGSAIGADGTLVRTIGSGPGVCLAAGIVADPLVAPTIERLFLPDLFSGWGLRTLSTQNPAFNPFAYHRGTVWPVENAIIARGLARLGRHRELHTLSLSLFELAALFESLRLPEVVAGHARDAEHPFPALYPKANWPQAWSASAVPAILQALLGMMPRASRKTLLLDPKLPAWLPEITVRKLRVGSGRVDLRFRRQASGSTDYEVLDLTGDLRVERADAGCHSHR